MRHLPQTRGRTGTALLIAAAAGLGAAACVQYRTRQTEARNPPRGKFVEADGVRLHYVERGQGEPLVMLHGTSTGALDILESPLFEKAARNYRVIVFDRPGYGYSDRPRGLTAWGPEDQAKIIHRALKQLGVEKPVLFGHSWGALVALAYALDFPDDLRSLVLASGYFYPKVRTETFTAGLAAVPSVGDALRYTVSPLMVRAMWPAVSARLFAPEPVTNSFRRFPVWMAARPSQIRAAAEMAIIQARTSSLSQRYNSLRVPAVIISGAADHYVPPRYHSDRLHREAPRTEYRAIPGKGHMLPHVAADEVMQAINDAAQLGQPARAPVRAVAGARA